MEILFDKTLAKPADKELLSKLFVYSTGESEATKPIPIANSDKEKCWLNVILQTFLFTRPMCGFLKTWREVFQGRISKLKDGDHFSLPLSSFRTQNMKFTVKLMNCAHMLTRLASEESEKDFDPTAFKKVLFKLKPSFKREYQDASEGLNEILKLFQDELLKSHQLLSLEGVTVNTIPLEEGFTVVTQHVTRDYLNGTKQDTRKQDWENPLIRLSVPNNIEHQTSVSDLMANKFNFRYEMKLDNGRTRIETEKIKKLPDCLIIELNKDVSGAKSARGNKGEVFVDPIFTVDPDWCVKPNTPEHIALPRTEYALRHFICYINEHYYAVTRRGGGNYESTWWKTSDHIIDELDEEDVLTKGHCKKATILYYEKI